jgi:hypothetical protein
LTNLEPRVNRGFSDLGFHLEKPGGQQQKAFWVKISATWHSFRSQKETTVFFLLGKSDNGHFPGLLITVHVLLVFNISFL